MSILELRNRTLILQFIIWCAWTNTVQLTLSSTTVQNGGRRLYQVGCGPCWPPGVDPLDGNTRQSVSLSIHLSTVQCTAKYLNNCCSDCWMNVVHILNQQHSALQTFMIGQTKSTALIAGTFSGPESQCTLSVANFLSSWGSSWALGNVSVAKMGHLLPSQLASAQHRCPSSSKLCSRCALHSTT